MKSILKYYNYLFANFYRWASGLSYEDSPEYTAFFSISFLVFCNVLTVLAFVRVLIGHPIGFGEISRWWIAGFALIIMTPQWFYLIRKKRYKKIISAFSFDNKSRDTLITWIYIIGSIGLLFLTVYVMILQNRNF
ncbi:hypothetical protein ACFLSE_10025 [Bacteroidota bacterium]